MENSKLISRNFLFLILFLIFGSGAIVLAEDNPLPSSGQPRVVYPEKTELDFDGLRIDGEVRNPGDFYFRHRPPEKFNSLIKKRENFHREMLRDAVMSR